MPDIKTLADAFDDYMLWLGFLPVGEDTRGNLCWRDEDAQPILGAIQFGVKRVDASASATLH
jgi:hypothetical protein